MDIKALKAPLDTAHIAQRRQGNQTLSYIEGWHAIAEANRIFGFDKWSRSLVRLEETNRDLVELRNQRGPYRQWRVGYLAVVRVTVIGGSEPVIRDGTGFGMGMAKPEALGDAIESAVKEAETDAMKRALVTFGNPFGLALYDKDRRNVADSSQAEPEPAPEPEPGATEPEMTSAERRAQCVMYLDDCTTLEDLIDLGNTVWMKGEIARMAKQDAEAVRKHYAARHQRLKPPTRMQANGTDNAGVFA